MSLPLRLLGACAALGLAILLVMAQSPGPQLQAPAANDNARQAATTTFVQQLVTFLRSGRGTASRLLKDKAADTLDLADFSGIDLTGRTDSTAGLQAAVDYAVSTTRLLNACGIVRISAEIVASGSFALLGCHDHGFQITMTNATQNGLVINGGECRIENVAIAAADDFKVSGYSVSLNATNRCKIVHNRFVGHYQGLRLNGTVATIVRGNGFESGVVRGDAIFMTGDDVASLIVDNIGNNNPGHSQNRGLVLSGNVQGTYVQRNSFLHYNVGLYVAPGDGRTIQNIFLSQNAWDSNNSQAAIYDSGRSGGIYRIISSGEWFAATVNGPGLQTVGTGNMSGWQFESPVFRDNGTSGALLLGSLSNAIFSNVVANANGQRAANLYNGVELGGTASHVQFNGGLLRGIVGEANSQAYGLVLRSGASDYIMVRGLDTTGNTLGSILNQSTGAHNLITTNLQ